MQLFTELFTHLHAVVSSARRNSHSLVWLTCGSRFQDCVARIKISPIAMSPMFALAHFSCSHSTPLTLTSSSSIPSSRTTSQVTLPINKQCPTSPNEESGFFGPNYLLQQVMSPTWSTTSTTQRFLKAILQEWIRRHRHGCPRTCTTRAQWRSPSADHSGARRTSEPSTSLSLSWRKLVVKSVVVCRSC